MKTFFFSRFSAFVYLFFGLFAFWKVVLPSIGVAASPAASTAATDPRLMTEMKQLTFTGVRAGEGYFSADGRKIIFQSERDEKNPFYQIYLMDLISGETQRVSPGKGATTCAWIHPNGKKVMFSSTHLDPQLEQKAKAEWEERKAPKKKYSWSFDDTFQIFEYDLGTKKYQQLTHEKGYNAEGNYSPDGKKIVFASNRAAFKPGLSEEDQKHVAMDPTWMMSIYVMDADGRNVKQLTDVRGYNGGPFFSPDGRKITWRRFTPDGSQAEVWVMNADGTEQKQITRMQSMSWAPFFHPSGDYLIFTTNKLGFNNFELYMVDVKGEREPVRVSYLDDFDGLPVFTPDGQNLSWTHRTAAGESQIWMSKWNDRKARELLGLPTSEPQRLTLNPDIRENDLKTWIQYLASEKMAGRGTGTPEEKIYTAKIAELFKDFGLSPVGDDYLGKFSFTSGVKLGEKGSLQIQVGSASLSYKPGDDYMPASFSRVGETAATGVVFGGYGIKAPATDTQSVFDSYKDLDVKGKWVLVFRDIPEGITNAERIHLNLYSRLQYKAMSAKQQGAVGLLVVTGPNSMSQQKVAKLKYDSRLDGQAGDAEIPVLSVSDSLAEKLLAPSGRSLKQWQDVLDKGTIQNTPLKEVTVASVVDLLTEKSTGSNVVGALQVPGARETLVIGAHGDHLGVGLAGASLAQGNEMGKVHYGADDNASGVAAVLELAQRWSVEYKAGRLPLKQNVIFAVWSGEELGLLGSNAFMKSFADQKNQREKISAYLNMDMIGRLQEKLVIQGVGSAKQWSPMLERLAVKTPMALSLVADPYLPTDSMTFYLKQIPTLSFFTGSHSEYHTPRDQEPLINYQGLKAVTEVVQTVAQEIATARGPRLEYQKIESTRKNMPGRSFRIFLGTIPDYTQDGIKGVKISGTSKASPAEKAGLAAGDVITEVAGMKIDNIYDYVYSLQALKAGQSVTVKIVREGKPQELSIVPATKE